MLLPPNKRKKYNYRPSRTAHSDAIIVTRSSRCNTGAYFETGFLNNVYGDITHNSVHRVRALRLRQREGVYSPRYYSGRRRLKD